MLSSCCGYDILYCCSKGFVSTAQQLWITAGSTFSFVSGRFQIRRLGKKKLWYTWVVCIGAGVVINLKAIVTPTCLAESSVTFADCEKDLERHDGRTVSVLDILPRWWKKVIFDKQMPFWQRQDTKEKPCSLHLYDSQDISRFCGQKFRFHKNRNSDSRICWKCIARVFEDYPQI